MKLYRVTLKGMTSSTEENAEFYRLTKKYGKLTLGETFELLEAGEKIKEVERLKKALRDIIKKGNDLPLSGRSPMIEIARKALREGK